MINKHEHKILSRRAKARKNLEEGNAEITYATLGQHYLEDTDYMLSRIDGLKKALEERDAHISELAGIIKRGGAEQKPASCR